VVAPAVIVGVVLVLVAVVSVGVVAAAGVFAAALAVVVAVAVTVGCCCWWWYVGGGAEGGLAAVVVIVAVLFVLVRLTRLFRSHSQIWAVDRETFLRMLPQRVGAFFTKDNSILKSHFNQTWPLAHLSLSPSLPKASGSFREEN